MPIALQAVTAFNLICTGIHSWGNLQPISMDQAANPTLHADHRERFTVRLRVDLDQGRWCRDDCTSIEAIHQVTDEQIIFHADGQRGSARVTMTNRQTGAYVDRTTVMFNEEIRTDSEIGTCRHAVFTGIPAPRG